MMSRIFSSTRYLVIMPILGLALAAALFFVIGGISLIGLLVDVVRQVISTGSVELHGEVPVSIAALALFIGLRTWSTKLENKEAQHEAVEIKEE